MSAFLQAEEQLRRTHDTQRAIAAVLELGLEDIGLEQLLHRALDLILAVPWLSLEKKAAIFVAEGEPGVLVMRAERGLAPPLRAKCSRVTFGQCLCGLAALSGAPVYAGGLDPRHHTRYQGIVDHGHYVVPIRRGEVVHGVLCTYLKAGHPRSQQEIEFLEAIASSLAGVLVRRRAEEERRKVQEQLAQSQRLDAVGRLAAGAAHDFANLLAIAQSSGQLLRRQLAGDEVAAGAVAALLRACQRGSELTRQLLAVGKRDTPHPEPLVLDRALRQMEGTLKRLVGEGVELRLELGASQARVVIDPGELERAMINLAANARDAMPSGGILRVRTASPPGGKVVLEVADTGEGMTPEVKARLFEPFFTTKSQSRGTGLGMSNILGIVRAAGGEIDLESEPGKGTTFRLSFPRAAEWLAHGEADSATPL